MKILIVHYRYYPVSGPERYMFNVTELFESKGHTVIPFSINYEDNKPSKYDKYFINPIGDKSNSNYSAQKKISFLNKIKIVLSFFYNKNANNKLNELIEKEKPDIALVLQFFGKLSISIFDTLNKNNIPVVLRLSDYGLICAKNTFYRNRSICTECLSNQINSLKHRCVHNSLPKSILNYLALKFSYLIKFQNKVDHIITPSLIMKNIFLEYKHFKKNQITHISTFYLTKDLNNHKINKFIANQDFCYLGRIDEDKGVNTLIEAIIILKERQVTPNILIIGDYNNAFAQSLIDKCIEYKLSNVDFAGLLNKKDTINKLSKCKYSVIPSLWYDNMPNSLIESQATGVPVIASDIGSLPELIIEDYNGFLFKPGDPIDLANKMVLAIHLSDNKLIQLKANAQTWAKEYCSEQKHYNSLMKIFEQLINEKFRK